MRPTSLLWSVFLLTLLPTINLLAQESNPSIQTVTHGPFVGHLTSTSAILWVRVANAQELTCTLTAVSNAQPDSKPIRVKATANPEHDFCVKFKFDNLDSDTTYQYAISFSNIQLTSGSRFKFRTPPSDNDNAEIRIAFGSCASENESTATVWSRLGEIKPQAFVMLGDTPYIDSTNLTKQRSRYRQFADVAEMAQLYRSTSMYGTWDDHDFGRNDTDGKLAGKENSRQAFIEYRANPSYGDGKQGIYTKFRRGCVEVFLLDTRYFAATEPSEFATGKPTLLGTKQWKWLKQSLKQSTATFKILACGMVWNRSVRIGKRDHWMNYPHERAELCRFLGAEKIGGVVLVAGDIHRSRVIRHSTAKTAGYDLFEFISSPMHSRIIAIADMPHPGLLFDAGEPNSFLLMATEDGSKSVVFQHQNAAGKTLFEKRLTANELTPSTKRKASTSSQIELVDAPGDDSGQPSLMPHRR